jgi:hypothetical protein
MLVPHENTSLLLEFKPLIEGNVCSLPTHHDCMTERNLARFPCIVHLTT